LPEYPVHDDPGKDAKEKVDRRHMHFTDA
jgi:hypothetical protein